MIVYRAEFPEGFQSLAINDAGLGAEEFLWLTTFDGSRKLPRWQAIEVFVPDPHLKRGNFFRFGDRAFAIDALAAFDIGEYIEPAVEFLPVDLAGTNERLYIINVIEVKNPRESGTFVAEELRGTPAFKQPGNHREIFLTQGFPEMEDLDVLLGNSELQGLSLLKVWERPEVDLTPLLQKGYALSQKLGPPTDSECKHLGDSIELHCEWTEGWYEYRNSARVRVAMLHVKWRILFVHSDYTDLFAHHAAGGFVLVSFADWDAFLFSIQVQWYNDVLATDALWSKWGNGTDPRAFSAWTFVCGHL